MSILTNHNHIIGNNKNKSKKVKTVNRFVDDTKPKFYYKYTKIIQEKDGTERKVSFQNGYVKQEFVFLKENQSENSIIYILDHCAREIQYVLKRQS